ncbi:MAG: metal-dependent hydrolase [Acidimicrobiia bacterium]|nr:metal-dependent hydrolase [Acidimicrobiia bacterium]
MGGTIALFRWIFRDPKVDLRLLALGAVLPDAIDLTVGVFLGEPTRQRVGHALVAPSLVGIGILLFTRRGRFRRQLMTVVVAWLFHLLLDVAWTRQETFLWPFFGAEFAAWPDGSAFARAASDPWRWVKEVVGLGYLVVLWRSLPASPDPARL